MASLPTFLGALLAFFLLSGVEGVLPFALATAAASFLYIAIAALVPILHAHNDLRSALLQLAFIGLGVACALALHATLG